MTDDCIIIAKDDRKIWKPNTSSTLSSLSLHFDWLGHELDRLLCEMWMKLLFESQQALWEKRWKLPKKININNTNRWWSLGFGKDDYNSMWNKGKSSKMRLRKYTKGFHNSDINFSLKTFLQLRRNLWNGIIKFFKNVPISCYYSFPYFLIHVYHK